MLTFNARRHRVIQQLIVLISCVFVCATTHSTTPQPLDNSKASSKNSAKTSTEITPEQTETVSSTTDDNQGNEDGKKCDESLPLRSDLYITPMDAPESVYGINFGTHPTPPDATATVKILTARNLNYDIVKVRDGSCREYFVVFHGSFDSVRKAENEMWRLLSFQNPSPYRSFRLKATVAKYPVTDDD